MYRSNKIFELAFSLPVECDFFFFFFLFDMDLIAKAFVLCSLLSFMKIWIGYV